MVKLVEIIGVTHNPFLPRLFREDPDCEPGIRAAFDNFSLMREKLKQAKPDVLIVVATDHLNQWFMDNMPPFLVGKAPAADGPFPQEVRNHKLTEYHTTIDVPLAKTLIREGYQNGVDLLSRTSLSSTMPSPCRSRLFAPRWIFRSCPYLPTL